MTENKSENNVDFVNEVKLLNKLPYAITVHDNNENIVYENSKAVDLFGLRSDSICRSRWCIHSDSLDNSCPLCPGKFTKQDQKQHKVFRKLIDSSLNVRYLEFETVPVLNSENESDGFIEIVRDVTEGETIKVNNLNAALEKTESRVYALMKHGNTGSEIVFTDKIYFVENDKEFLLKLASFAFIGIIQNNQTVRSGLYGPLPVLDEKQKEMYTYTFTTTDLTILDKRKHNQEILLLLIIFERNDPTVAINRQLINDLISSYVFRTKNITDLTPEWFNLVKTEINKLIDL